MMQYKKIYQILKHSISNGSIAVGQRMPSENELTALYGVARSTVRLALAQLEKDGMIEKKQGFGSVVISKRRTLSLLSYKGFTESLAESTHKIKTQTLQTIEESILPEKIFKDLLPEEQLTYFNFVRVRYIDELPVMYESTYIPKGQLHQFERLYTPENSLFEFLHAHYRIEVLGMQQDIIAINAEKTLAKILGLKKNAAVLQIMRKYETSKQGFYFYSLLFCNTTAFQWSNYKPTVYLAEV